MKDTGPGTVLLVVLAAATVVAVSGGDDTGTPSIERVVPDISLCTTARTITIEGSNFSGDDLVYLGSKLLKKVEIDGRRRIEAKLPEDVDSGTYEIKVVSAEHRKGARSRLTILPSETAPVIRELVPHAAVAGTRPVIRIIGANFRAGARVALRGYGGLATRLAGEGLIEARLPATVPPGTYDVEVENGDGEKGVLHRGLQVIRPQREHGGSGTLQRTGAERKDWHP